MKASSHVWVLITTMALITVTIMSVMDFSFNWIFYCTVLGQTLVILMVYKVLKEKYSTHKVFDDFYEDAPIGDRIN
ncbi:hypothetical protein J8L85_05540 [Maribacter sp. MMG018]|uniref:hypothetical protein n=1 Tax=Maribacter sp. MMG018 TaxID=2822688 RepID=UPI001B361708|nr:hypothetical protein [Maribacter sp. MMG018]MBQ4913890.1 hypothetical protein [Maribacter sp. MMG018]